MQEKKCFELMMAGWQGGSGTLAFFGLANPGVSQFNFWLLERLSFGILGPMFLAL